MPLILASWSAHMRILIFACLQLFHQSCFICFIFSKNFSIFLTVGGILLEWTLSVDLNQKSCWIPLICAFKFSFTLGDAFFYYLWIFSSICSIQEENYLHISTPLSIFHIDYLFSLYFFVPFLCILTFFSSFFFFNFYLFIYLLFLAVLGLRFSSRALSSCGERGPLFITVRRPLTVAASLAAEHRLQTRRLSSRGSRAQLLRGMWDPPRPRLEPASPALAGRLSTTAPPGKPFSQVFGTESDTHSLFSCIFFCYFLKV